MGKTLTYTILGKTDELLHYLELLEQGFKSK